MMHDPEQALVPTPSPAHWVHQAVHFLRLVRRRQRVVLLALVIAAALGGLYFATAPRCYQAQASLLVLQSGNEVLNTSMSPEGATQGLMPTYERLLSSAVVLEAALGHLRPEDRIDIAHLPPEQWLDELRKQLCVSTVRRTNLMDVGFRSRNPHTAVAVVNAVVRAYLEFMEKTHRGTAGEIIAVLTREKAALETRLAQKEVEILEIRRRFGDLGIRAGDKVLHPVVQRAVQLNEALVEAQKKRLELQASLAAIQGSIQRGEDLQQHVLAVENAVGREFLLTGLGFNNRDIYTHAAMEKGLLEDRAQLQTLLEYFGPAHPRVAEAREKVRLTEQYLLGYQEKINQRLAHVRENKLAPLLVQMVQQRLHEAWQHEQSLAAGFDEARREAVDLNGHLAQLEIAENDLRWLRDLRETLLNQIAGIDLKQNQGEIRAAVVSKPVAAERPSSPRPLPVALICLVGGLLAGLMLVFVLDTLDDRFRSPDELRAQLGVPVLAMIRRLEGLSTRGLEALQLYVAPEEAESEGFRTLRTALAFSGQETRRLVVSSAEPGDGKTTLLGNLAVCYAQAGKKTLLIDADMRRPGLTSLLQMRGAGGLSELLRREGDVGATAPRLIRPSGISGLDVLPCGPRPSNPAELLASAHFVDLLAWAETAYDQVLVDGPPALAASDAAIIGRVVDGVVLVVRPDKNQRRLVLRAAENFAALGVALVGVVVNRISGDEDQEYYGYGVGDGYSGYPEDPLHEAEPHDEIAEEPRPVLPAVQPRRVA